MNKNTLEISAIDPKALTFTPNKNGKHVAKVAPVEVTIGSYTYKAFVSVYRVNAAEAEKAKPQPVAVTKADDRFQALESRIDSLTDAMSKLVAMQMAAIEAPKAKTQRVRQ